MSKRLQPDLPEPDERTRTQICMLWGKKKTAEKIAKYLGLEVELVERVIQQLEEEAAAMSSSSDEARSSRPQ